MYCGYLRLPKSWKKNGAYTVMGICALHPEYQCQKTIYPTTDSMEECEKYKRYFKK